MIIRKIKLFLPVIIAVIVATTMSVAGTCFAGTVHSEAPTSGSRPGESTVLTGIDVLERNNFRQLDSQRIGLITNQTGINAAGISTIQLLYDAKNIDLRAIFSPEHGLLGKLDIPQIENSIDTKTGMEVFSLYGSTRKPDADMLTGIDTLVFDIQDIGTRFYTYISTMGLAMQAAAEHNKRFVVLDRPNPINGLTVSGPMLDEGRQSFTGFHRLPVRHGMTIGELALMIKTDLVLDLELEIIQLEGWQRTEFFDTTGLPWVNPSPNMRSLTEAILYPGIGLLETTNLSVGRGTDTPFELFGAPWLDGNQLVRELKQLELPGISFTAIRFTPDASKFEGELCVGVGIRITDREQFEPVRSGLEIAVQLRRLYPQQWEVEKYDRLLVNTAVLNAVRQARPYADIHELFVDDLQTFIGHRAGFLIYK